MTAQRIKHYRVGHGDVRHQFEQADGRWQVCGGKGKCRECIREEDLAKRGKEPTDGK